MTIVSHKHRIAFFPMAKNCSTSVKHLFYRLETGMSFHKAREKYGLSGHVHKYYPSQAKEKWRSIYGEYDTVTIVRDPIKRFLSAYSNRVVHFNALETRVNAADKIKLIGYPLQPTLEEFVQNLEIYCEASPYMRKHIAPQESIIGDFFSKIKWVYDTSQIPEFEAFMSERYGKPIIMPHAQNGGPKLTTDDLSKSSLKKLRQFYKNDYKMLRQFYKLSWF
ncbi:MAG: sulfotransferase family 2 domain-containing protein [Gallionellaceae bacterium]